MENTNQNQFTRDDFMNFFRDDECLNQLSPDDRIEVFSQILLGSSDFTKELLDDILSDYSVDTLEIVEVPPMQHSAKVIFGREAVNKYHEGVALTPEEKEIHQTTFYFSASSETAAFYKGVEEAIGWTEYVVVE